MIKEISINSFLKPLGQGITKPMLVLGNDYKNYILKNQRIDNNGSLVNYNCMFLNELLAYQVGQFLGVPMPEAVIAYLDKIFIDNDPTIRFAYRYVEGYHFASEELENIENNIIENVEEQMKMGKPYIRKTWNNFFNNIINKKDIAVVLAFDLLIGNFDRYCNEGNILISDTDEGRKIFAIDHGHAFWGPIWDPSKIGALKIDTSDPAYVDWYINQIIVDNVNRGNLNGLGSMFKALEYFVDLQDTNEHSFQDVVEKIEGISEDYLDECLNNIPKEWFIDKAAQSAYYKKFILNQKDLIRYFIQRLSERGAFTNFRGGILKWKEEKQFGTA